MEIEALLNEDDEKTAAGLFEAAKNYARANQNMEALLSGLASAYLAWKSDSSVFPMVLKLIAPLVRLHPGFKKDPLLGGFMAGLEPFLIQTLGKVEEKTGLSAEMIGRLRVMVDGREISVRKWHNNKAIKALLYLLLAPNHRIPVDHLFYLLWPRRSLSRKNKRSLYTAINIIRRRLGKRELLVQHRDFYQLEDVWTDLDELQNLIRLADVAQDPDERRDLLNKAKQLAKGELLPEFPYDKHIEEYRHFYNKLRSKL